MRSRSLGRWAEGALLPYPRLFCGLASSLSPTSHPSLPSSLPGRKYDQRQGTKGGFPWALGDPKKLQVREGGQLDPPEAQDWKGLGWTHTKQLSQQQHCSELSRVGPGQSWGHRGPLEGKFSQHPFSLGTCDRPRWPVLSCTLRPGRLTPQARVSTNMRTTRGDAHCPPCSTGPLPVIFTKQVLFEG